MGTKVFAVRIGDKYGQDIEDYINSKIPNVTWIRDEYPGIKLQWNKLRVMDYDIDDPVVVIDIDMFFINDYMEAIEYPIQQGEFLAGRSWWKDTKLGNFELNGGFQKYYPKDCKYIFEEFMSRPQYWQKHFKNHHVIRRPVCGEQFFVEEQVRKKLKLKFLPDQWFVKFKNNPSIDYIKDMSKKYPGDLFIDHQLNNQIKIIHFMDHDVSSKDFFIS